MRSFEPFPLLRAEHLCSVEGRRGGAVRKDQGVNWLKHLVLRLGARNFSLVCPRCQQPASSLTFRRGRYMLGDEMLACEHCGETSLVTFWRFEGLSGEPGCSEAGRHESLANSQH